MDAESIRQRLLRDDCNTDRRRGLHEDRRDRDRRDRIDRSTTTTEQENDRDDAHRGSGVQSERPA